MTNALAYSIRLSIITQKIYNAATWIGVKINNLCCRPKKEVTRVFCPGKLFLPCLTLASKHRCSFQGPMS